MPPRIKRSNVRCRPMSMPYAVDRRITSMRSFRHLKYLTTLAVSLPRNMARSGLARKRVDLRMYLLILPPKSVFSSLFFLVWCGAPLPMYVHVICRRRNDSDLHTSAPHVCLSILDSYRKNPIFHLQYFHYDSVTYVSSNFILSLKEAFCPRS